MGSSSVDALDKVLLVLLALIFWMLSLLTGVAWMVWT